MWRYIQLLYKKYDPQKHMLISFENLNEKHFPLMVQWLEAPHVKKWWDQEITYNIDLVKEKYQDCVKGYRLSGNIEKPIQAYIININSKPVGYIQLYNAYDFPRDIKIVKLPHSLGAIDIFIGEESYIGHSVGSKAVAQFLQEYALKSYRYIFVDPECDNEAAVRCYEKAGFTIIKHISKCFWMIMRKPFARLSIQDSIALEVAFRESFLPQDQLWIFGSRADLTKKGGDIDLYIETNANLDEGVMKQSHFWSKLQQLLGEQQIDIVLNIINNSKILPIYEIAKKEGVRII